MQYKEMGHDCFVVMTHFFISEFCYIAFLYYREKTHADMMQQIEDMLTDLFYLI